MKTENYIFHFYLYLLTRDFSRWKRRFGNRAEIESSPSDEILAEVEDNIPLGRPYLLNNKIYPGIQQQESVKEKVGVWGWRSFSLFEAEKIILG